MLTVFFLADMADHSFNTKPLTFQMLKSWVNVRLFTAADNYTCTFTTEPLGNCKTNTISTDTDYVQFDETSPAVIMWLSITTNFYY